MTLFPITIDGQQQQSPLHHCYYPLFKLPPNPEFSGKCSSRCALPKSHTLFFTPLTAQFCSLVAYSSQSTYGVLTVSIARIGYSSLLILIVLDIETSSRLLFRPTYSLFSLAWLAFRPFTAAIIVPTVAIMSITTSISTTFILLNLCYTRLGLNRLYPHTSTHTRTHTYIHTYGEREGERDKETYTHTQRSSIVYVSAFTIGQSGK